MEKRFELVLNNLILLLGNGEDQTEEEDTQDLKEIVIKLTWRNYPELMEWNGKDKLVIFIPDHYLIKVPVYPDPTRGAELVENCREMYQRHPERKEEFKRHGDKIEGAKNQYDGDKVEMDLYEILEERCQKRNETIAVFHSLDLHKFEKGIVSEESSEKDFILINSTCAYIMLIEVKKKLDMTKLRKSLKQLYDNKEKLKQYLKTGLLMNHLSMREEWVVIPMIYCETLQDINNLCRVCDLHVIAGNNLANSQFKNGT